MALYGNSMGYGGGYMPQMQMQAQYNTGQQMGQMPQQMGQTIPQIQSQPQPQIQNGGFVSVRSETEARNYPVAPGNSVTFKDENLPFVYVKTMGFSQLDRPNFDKFKLVRVNEMEEQESGEIRHENTPKVNYISKEEFEPYLTEIDELKKEINDLKSKMGNRNKNLEKRSEGEVMK